MSDIRIVRDELAEALSQKATIDALYESAHAAWLAEMKPLIDRQAEIAKRVKELDAAARTAIREAVEQEGPDALKDVTGFAYATTHTIHYDEAQLLAFAKKHAPHLLTEKLVTMTAIKNWLTGQTKSPNLLTGETMRVLNEESGAVEIPIEERLELQPRISDTALTTLVNERKWLAEREQEMKED